MPLYGCSAVCACLFMPKNRSANSQECLETGTNFLLCFVNVDMHVCANVNLQTT